MFFHELFEISFVSNVFHDVFQDIKYFWYRISN